MNVNICRSIFRWKFTGKLIYMIIYLKLTMNVLQVTFDKPDINIQQINRLLHWSLLEIRDIYH